MANTRQTRLAASAPTAAGVILTAALALTAPVVHAADYFGAGLTRGSAWEDILKTTRIHLEFPFVSFGNVYVPLPGTCVDDGHTLRPVDASLRGRALLVRDTPLAPSPLVTVHRMPEGKDVEGKMIWLFNKPWAIAECRR